MMVAGLINDMIIDRGSHVPPYRQIRDMLVDRIRKGQLRHGEQLPISTALRESLAVSHHTLNRAMQELKREGWVTARSGSGTFVAAGPAQAPATPCPSPDLGVPDLSWMGSRKTRFLNELQQRVPGVRLIEGPGRHDVVNAYAPMLPCLAPELADLAGALLPEWGRNSVDDPIVAPFCYEGRLLIAESAPTVGVVMANEHLLAEAGAPLPTSDWTLAEFMDLARRAHAPERGRYGVSFFGNYLDFTYFLAHEGGTFFDADGLTCALGRPEAVRAMRLMGELAALSAPGDMRTRAAAFGEGRAALLIGYSGGVISAHRRLSAPHRLLCLPDYRTGVVPLDAGGMSMRATCACPEAAAQFLRLMLEVRRWGVSSELIPLCVNSAWEDTSAFMRPFRESLGYAREILWNVPARRRSPKQDLILNLFDARCPQIAFGEPSLIAERMRSLAEDMTHMLAGERMASHFERI